MMRPEFVADAFVAVCQLADRDLAASRGPPSSSKAASYMVLLDDKVAEKNRRRRKQFDISGIKTTALL